MTDEMDDKGTGFGVPLVPAGGQWRQGDGNDTTIYLQVGILPDNAADIPLGYALTPQAAKLVVDSVNNRWALEERLRMAEDILADVLGAVDADLGADIKLFLWRGEAYPIHEREADNGPDAG